MNDPFFGIIKASLYLGLKPKGLKFKCAWKSIYLFFSSLVGA